jgi:hypothetical protein
MQRQLKYASIRQFTTFKKTIAIAVTAAAWCEILGVFVDYCIVDDVNGHDGLFFKMMQ